MLHELLLASKLSMYIKSAAMAGPAVEMVSVANNDTDIGADETEEQDEKVVKRRVLEEKYGTQLEGIELVWVEGKSEGEWVAKYELAKLCGLKMHGESRMKVGMVEYH